MLRSPSPAPSGSLSLRCLLLLRSRWGDGTSYESDSVREEVSSHQHRNQNSLNMYSNRTEQFIIYPQQISKSVLSQLLALLCLLVLLLLLFVMLLHRLFVNRQRGLRCVGAFPIVGCVGSHGGAPDGSFASTSVVL